MPFKLACLLKKSTNLLSACGWEHKTCDTVGEREISPLTSMTVHCSTTMASYVGAAAFGSPSLPSWKMKTLSTDFAIISAEKRREKKSSREKSIYWMERVCLVSAAPSGPSGQRKWNDITQPHSHTTHYYIASGVGHLYEQCALIHYAGRQCKRKEQVFPFWDVKKEEETLRATSVGFQRAQSSAGFHVRHLNRG